MSRIKWAKRIIDILKLIEIEKTRCDGGGTGGARGGLRQTSGLALKPRFFKPRRNFKKI